MGRKDDMYHEFMQEALKEARCALEEREVPVGCVIVSPESTTGGSWKILTRGHNRTVISKNPTQHAEIVAINKLFEKQPIDTAKKQLQESILFVSVEPCIMCTKALIKVGVKQAVFGAYNDKFGGCGSVLDLTGGENRQQLEVVGGLCKEDAISLLRQFYDRPNEAAPNPRKKQREAV